MKFLFSFILFNSSKAGLNCSYIIFCFFLHLIVEVDQLDGEKIKFSNNFGMNKCNISNSVTKCLAT